MGHHDGNADDPANHNQERTQTSGFTVDPPHGSDLQDANDQDGKGGKEVSGSGCHLGGWRI